MSLYSRDSNNDVRQDPTHTKQLASFCPFLCLSLCLLACAHQTLLHRPPDNADNYGQVHDYASKAEHPTIPGDTSLHNKVRAASGLAYVGEGRFEQAAKALMIVKGGDESVGTFACLEDICLYTVLCGIATLDRDELIRLQESSPLLELVPVAADVLQRFCRADYQSCLMVLQQQLLPVLQLDRQIANQLPKLLETILERCLVEYLRPYRKVHLSQMATAFGMETNHLIATLARLIRNGRIQYTRLDCQSQTLWKDSSSLEVAERQEQSSNKVKSLQDNVLNDAYAMLIRMACLDYDISFDRRKGMMTMGDDDDDGIGDMINDGELDVPAVAGMPAAMDQEGGGNDDEPMELVEANPEDVY